MTEMTNHYDIFGEIIKHVMAVAEAAPISGV